MSRATTPQPERPARPWTDLKGWIVLAWVLVWSLAYVDSALATRFPWIRSWIDGLF